MPIEFIKPRKIFLIKAKAKHGNTFRIKEYICSSFTHWLKSNKKGHNVTKPSFQLMLPGDIILSKMSESQNTDNMQQDT